MPIDSTVRLVVATIATDRRARLHTHRLVAEHGVDMAAPALLQILAADRAHAGGAGARCGLSL